MAQKKEVYKETLKQTGYWKYSELYEMMFSWFKNRDYILQEDLYNEKILSNGKEVIIKWTATREITDYFKFQMILEWHILGMKDAEVEIDGEKIKTNKGEIEIVFKANIIKDYEKRWEDKPLWKFLRSVYEKYVVRETIDEYESDIAEEIKQLINDVKAILRTSHKLR